MEWLLNGRRHRVDGPAFITPHDIWWNRESGLFTTNWRKEWWLNGKLHRTDGPAIEYFNGDSVWYLDGKKSQSAVINANGVIGST